MSPRRRLLAVLTATACSAPPVDPKPAPAPPAPDPRPPAEPFPEAIRAPTPDLPPAADPPDPTRPAPRRWHLAAVREGSLALHALTDGSVAVRGSIAFAIAPPRAGPLRRERTWTRSLALGDDERDATQVDALHGRWPDLAFLTTHSDRGRIADLHTTLRWQDGAWMPETPPAPAGQVPHYPAIAGTATGPLAGLRSFVIDENDFDRLGDPDEPGPPTPTLPHPARPVLDRLTPEGRAPGPWPALPAGPAGTGLLALDNGDLVVLRAGPVVQHWRVGSKSWEKLPAPGYTTTDTPLLAGRDPSRIHLASCHDGESDTKPRLHRFDGARWIRLAAPACIQSLSEAEDTTLWIVAGGQLYRDDPGEPQRWDPVDLGSFPLGGRETPAWRPGSYGSPWRESPAEPPSSPKLTPTSVLAFGTGDIWVTASADDTRFSDAELRHVALTTRAIANKTPLQLPDDLLASLEAHAQEPDVVPTSPDTACHDMMLDLGNRPAVALTRRPPELHAALQDDDHDLRRLAVVLTDLGATHGLSILWLADPPDPRTAYTLLSGLADRLRSAHPRVRLLCRVPIVTRVLP